MGDILNETFAIYGKHIRRFLVLVAIVQVPVSVVIQLVGGGLAGVVIFAILGIIGSMIVYSAGVFAVAQHYVVGEIDISECYRRVSWRGVTLVAVAAVISLALGVGGGLFFLVLPLILAVAYVVYWSMAVQAVMIEGHTLRGALKRSFELVRGSWWRVFGLMVVFWLVATGLGFIIDAPFALADRFAVPDEATLASRLIALIATIAVAVVVPPVLAIAGTLLYYDLRVRKEDYDFATLSRETGIAAV